MCHSEQLYIFQSWVQAIFIILYAAIFVVGVAGNLVVLYVILSNKHKRTTVNIYLINLSASDIVMSVFSFSSPSQGIFNHGWVLGDALCKLASPSIYVTIYMSTLTLTAIAVNRFLAVFYPFSTRNNSHTRTVVIILCIDIVAVICSLPYALVMTLDPDSRQEYLWDLQIKIKKPGILFRKS